MPTQIAKTDSSKNLLDCEGLPSANLLGLIEVVYCEPG